MRRSDRGAERIRRRLARLCLATAIAFLAASCSLFKPAGEENAATIFPNDGDTVVVVHGLRWWSLGGMDWMARRFHRDGCGVVLVRYPSRRLDGDGIIKGYLDAAVRAANHNRERRLHFVAHSMGAVLVHRYLQDHPPPNLGRCVFIGTPHHGTQLADLAARKMRWLLPLIGPAAASLNTSGGGLPDQLRPPEFPAGVIMGDFSSYPFLSPCIPGRDDGVVPVEGGRIAGAADFLVVHETHVRLIRSPEVYEQSREFLRTGAFDRSRQPPRPRMIDMRSRGLAGIKAGSGWK